jgi:hypothetical protein
MTSLSTRIASAEVGSRELDAEIAVLDGWCLHPNKTYEAVQGDSGFTCEDCRANSWGNRSNNVHRQRLHDPVPTYTTSLDAALALAERVLPGWGFYLRQDKDGCGCGMVYPEYNSVTAGHFTAPTPALALCAAVLKAVESKA